MVLVKKGIKRRTFGLKDIKAQRDAVHSRGITKHDGSFVRLIEGVYRRRREEDGATGGNGNHAA